MNLFSKFLLSNRLLVILLSSILCVGGAFSYFSLPVDAFPDVSPVLVQVFTVTDGLAPEEIEKQVSWPVETAMNGLPNIEKIRSVSNFGLSVVNIYFEEGTDIYFARQLVNERLEEARDSIPYGFGEPEMGPISTGQGQILYYYLQDDTGQYSLTQLRDIQDWVIKVQLQTVEGVTEVLGIGGWEKQYHLKINPFALQKYNLTILDAIESIKSSNLNVGAQYIENAGEQLLVSSEGLIESITDLKKIVIKSENGRSVLLQDIADISVGGAVRRGLQTRNGEKEIVAGMVIKLLGTNSSSVITRVEKRLIEIEKALPPGIKIIPFYEQKTLVNSSVKTVLSALLQGIFLVLLVLILFLRSVRPSIVVAMSIPFSILISFGVMKITGISANLMSFGGLAIAIGMIVDGAIVLTEIIERRTKELNPTSSGGNNSFLNIVSDAYSEAGRSIFFSILIVIVVFLPLFTLEGVEGKTFRPLAYTVAIVMGVALIYALVVVPVLASFMMKPTNKIKKQKSNLTPKSNQILNLYEKTLKAFIQRKWMVALSIILLGITAAVIYPFLGSEFTPRLNEGDIMVNLTFSPSASISETKRNVLILEKQMLKIEEVEEVISRIGRGEVGAHSAPVNVVHTNVLLHNKKKWRKGYSQKSIESDLREILEIYPGVLANITQPIQLSVDELVGGVKAQLAVKLFGENLNEIKIGAESIAKTLEKIEGSADIMVEQMTGSPQLVIKPNRKKIAQYGINMADVQQTIEAMVGGVTVGQIFEGLRRYDLFIRGIEHSRNDIESIKKIMISGENGIRIPLEQLATIKTVTGPRQILRENGSRFVSIQCNVVGRDIGSFVKDAQKLIDEEVKLPIASYLKWGGQFELQQKANRRLLVVVPFTLLLVAFLIFLNFKSVIDTILILINIPPALAGGIISLKISGEHLSVPASVGFIALFGIALGNGLVLISAVKSFREKGLTPFDAIIMAAKQRVRPVLMTALTTALGLVPLLISQGTGSEVQKPLAFVVVGGLLTSTLVTLFILPAFYQLFYKNKTVD